MCTIIRENAVDLVLNPQLDEDLRKIALVLATKALYTVGKYPHPPGEDLTDNILALLSSLNVPPGMYQAHMQANQHALLQAQPAPHPHLQG